MPDRTQIARVVDKPEVGFYLIKLVKGGPWVAARIDQNDEGWWSCTIDGVEYPSSPDPVLAPKLVGIWTHGVRSTEQEYRYRLELKRWNKEAGTDHPSVNPDRRIDLNTMKPIF